MGLGDLLDGAVRLYRANFWTVALIGLVFSGSVQLLIGGVLAGAASPTSVLDALDDPSVADPSDPFAGQGFQLGASLLALLATLVVQPLVSGAVAKAVASSYLGTQLTAWQAVRAALRRFPALLAASAMVGLTLGLGLLGCCVGIVFVAPLWAATAPAIVVEGLGPVAGMKRSFGLVTRRYWPVLGTVVLTYLLVQTLGSIVGLPASLAASLLGGWGFLLAGAAGALASMLVEPITAIVYTLVYFDLRIRNEGFDLQVMAGDLGAPARAGP